MYKICTKILRGLPRADQGVGLTTELNTVGIAVDTITVGSIIGMILRSTYSIGGGANADVVIVTG